MGKIKNTRVIFIVLAVLLFVISILSISMGDVNISFKESYSIIWNKIIRLLNINKLANSNSTYELIVMNLRLPRIIGAIFVGIGLSCVGCAYQGVFRNTMADPYVLGVSSGATLGATIFIIFNLTSNIFGFAFISFGAFLGAIITTFLVYFIAFKQGKLDTTNLLLSGIAMSFLINSIVSMIIVFNENNVSKIVFWTMGNLSGINYYQLIIIIVFVLIGVFLLYYYNKELDILSTGEDIAKTLGVDTFSLKKKIMFISSIIVAVCVSFTGIIGFCGLMIPHISRILVGAKHKKLIPYSAVLGAIFMVFSDTLARSIIDSAELPVGSITALFGAPFFILLLLKRRKV